MPADRRGAAAPGERLDPAARRFLALYALAYAGGVVAYLPLLSLLLPLKVATMAGGARIGLLALVTIGGASAASLSNVVFGALSDRSWRRHGSRRRWIAGGLVATLASYAGVALAAGPAALIGAVVAYQGALNMMLAPLMATLADAVPDRHKGLAAGLLAPAQPVAALAGAAVIGWAPGQGAAFPLLAAIAAVFVLPLLLAGRPPVAPIVAASAGRALRRADLAVLWTSRLLVQVAVSVLSTFLLFFFAGVAGGEQETVLAGRLGRITAAAYCLAIPVALIVGRASDRTGSRRRFLLVAAIVAAVGLVLMTVAGSAGMPGVAGWRLSVAGYGLFAVATAAFLALQATYAMQILPSPQHRGRDLGTVNLANTLPQLLGPALTWALSGEMSGEISGGLAGGPVGAAPFAHVLAVLAVLTLVGGLLMLAVDRRAPAP